jgi:hypothetical protein
MQHAQHNSNAPFWCQMFPGMLSLRRAAVFAVLALALFAPAAAFAQSYPARSIRLIVPFTPGLYFGPVVNLLPHIRPASSRSSAG